MFNINIYIYISIKSNKFFHNNTNIVKCILFVTDIRDGHTKKVCVHHAKEKVIIAIFVPFIKVIYNPR